METQASHDQIDRDTAYNLLMGWWLIAPYPPEWLPELVQLSTWPREELLNVLAEVIDEVGGTVTCSTAEALDLFMRDLRTAQASFPIAHSW